MGSWDSRRRSSSTRSPSNARGTSRSRKSHAGSHVSTSKRDKTRETADWRLGTRTPCRALALSRVMSHSDHPTCSLWPSTPSDETLGRVGIAIERGPMQGRSGRCPHYISVYMPALHARTTCPRRGPPWAPGVSVVCSCVRLSGCDTHGISHEHVRGGRGAWDQP